MKFRNEKANAKIILCGLLTSRWYAINKITPVCIYLNFTPSPLPMYTISIEGHSKGKVGSEKAALLYVHTQHLLLTDKLNAQPNDFCVVPDLFMPVSRSIYLVIVTV